jgi:hypothetical protein
MCDGFLNIWYTQINAGYGTIYFHGENKNRGEHMINSVHGHGCILV